MLTASQNIDNFIERQRSKLSKAPSRQQVNRQRPAPPPPPPPPPPASLLPPPPAPQTVPPINVEDRLDLKVARILDEPSPRVHSEQPYYPPTSRPFTSNSFPEEQSVGFISERDPRHFTSRSEGDNQFSFFDNFGRHDEKRAQLKDDLKREYNEFLRSEKNTPKNKSLSQAAASRRNTTRHVRFSQGGIVVAPWEKNGSKKQQSLVNTNNMPPPSRTAEPTVNRSLSRISEIPDEQYIRDREEYILELYEQIRELEARKRQLETGMFYIHEE